MGNTVVRAAARQPNNGGSQNTWSLRAAAKILGESSAEIAVLDCAFWFCGGERGDVTHPPAPLMAVGVGQRHRPSHDRAAAVGAGASDVVGAG
jgi:hypothetical protein